MRGALGDQTLIYLQIAQLLEDDILRGVYREEEQVPSTNELSRCYNINPATAAKGITCWWLTEFCISAGESACLYLREAWKKCGKNEKRHSARAISSP